MNTTKPFPVSKYEFVIAKVQATGRTTYKFEVNELLRNKKIKGIAIYLADYLSFDPNGNPLVPVADGKARGFLTLKTTKAVESINKIPLFVLAPGVNTGGTYEKYYPIDNLVIDFEQSYISMANTTVGTMAVGQVFMLGVVYTDDETTCDVIKK